MDSRMLRIPSGSGKLQKKETKPAKARGVCLGNICHLDKNA